MLKMDNISYKKMIDVIYSFEIKKQDESSEDDCEHDIIIAENTHVCRLCGQVQDMTMFCSENGEMNYIRYHQRYNKAKHFANKIQRLSGYCYPMDQEINLEKISSNITKIRKYLKRKKLHPKNDFYLWRLKNNVTATIPKNLELKWVQEFKKQKLSAKKFLCNKFTQYPEYQVFLEFFVQKTIKKTQ